MSDVGPCPPAYVMEERGVEPPFPYLATIEDGDHLIVSRKKGGNWVAACGFEFDGEWVPEPGPYLGIDMCGPCGEEFERHDVVVEEERREVPA